ncbi:hypothetical protein [Chondromyces crocatus]|uniref:Uncharacterized protein n=1 Tax=Chondromyces crocatus TaxID=52 RepID=A0A0K1E9G6_CHOCO|nr:hypothetical protein [Chondromyces crocatus]AKT37322.1 uncharacterized protein CMC5_014550 [Chondromyces crocatus]
MHFGLPRDVAPWICLGLAALLVSILALTARMRRRRAPAISVAGPSAPRPLSRRASRLFLGAAAFSAAALSVAYEPTYLRGGPRIIDATSYWLEARAMARGHLSWPVEEPVASTLGRFLVRGDRLPPTTHPVTSGAQMGSEDATPAPAAPTVPTRVAVIFPPGYPAVLALGFVLGLPGLVGPLLAAALVIVTWDLAARLFPDRKGGVPLVPALAALFSVTCAALRYHTADTMSHGLAALCFAGALTCSLRALASPGSPLPAALLSGFFAGWLAATRPPSALALAVTLLCLMVSRFRAAPGEGHRNSSRLVLVTLLGALPGLLLLCAHQRAATGSWASSQSLYYAVSDGPPGCFRYGFGVGIGCLGEHGDFVRHNLARGYDALAVAGTTLRRLKMHLVDPLNAEPLAALVVAGAFVVWRTPGARFLLLALLAQLAAYAPFYFDGNYPAGGARFYADVLPLEHVLAAAALAAWVDRAPRSTPRLSRFFGLSRPLAPLALGVALPLSGFAFRGGFDHAQLRDRDGGLPMFDPAVLSGNGITRGLVFVDTDHGFNLGHDPAREAPLQVLRFRGDALDAMAWEAHGRPPAYRYHFRGLPSPTHAPRTAPPWLPLSHDPAAEAAQSASELLSVAWIEPLSFEPIGDGEKPAIIEGESLWPPRDQRLAWALPEHAAGTCASAGRWLVVRSVSEVGPPEDVAAHDDSERDVLAPSATDAAARLVRVALPTPWLRGAFVAPRIAIEGADPAVVRLLVDGVVHHEWRWRAPESASSDEGSRIHCAWLDAQPVAEDAAEVELALVPPGGAPAVFALDAVRIAGAKPVDRDGRNR